jgi:hypothetical protein
MHEAPDRAVAAWITTMSAAAALPVGRLTRQGTAVSVISGLRVPTLNTVVSTTVEPDVAALSGLAAKLRTEDLPWSIQIRGGPGADVARLAMASGLSGRRTLPFMICDAGEARLSARAVPGAAVVRVGAADRRAHGRALDLGFDTGGDVLAPIAESTALDAPGWFAAGATLAYLHSSLMAEQLHRSMGFRVAETWTVFS